ncbi:MAG: hypothetical protein F4X97_11120 [Boseongicola sp. SB0662_bin_57]|nr:hypothetical protein [Boseongicola sp. SB0662_bin_57]
MSVPKRLNPRGSAALALRETRVAATGERGSKRRLERPGSTRDRVANRGRNSERLKAPEPERAAELERPRGSRNAGMEM